MKEIIVGLALMIATATPVFAQAYCACWGTGNVEAIAEQTNRAYGYAMSVTPQGDAATLGHASRHMKRNQRR